MAFASLFTLLDDITSMLDDVAMMAKVATKKTAGVVGDDLALNANQVTGVRADRELPIVWAVAKGSFLNKTILIPLALLLSAFLPILIKPLLIIGGAYLCFEGVEKLIHKLLQHHENTPTPNTKPDELLDEKTKIKGAIRTDFILSAEIIIIALGVVENEPLLSKAIVMTAIGIGLTIFVYGLVGIIVKLDDFGFWLMKSHSSAMRALGNSLIHFVPWFMRALSIMGTLAMFLVGGGIIAHNWPWLHNFLHIHHWNSGFISHIAHLIVGLFAGALICTIALPLSKAFSKH